ncbi:MAG TPA: T9SS type A sorting domain-containing protein [Bacteroidia bacterium]|nr:T9SS type A sorting domain-containing protein [Bacteroidia bacterium]
MSNSFRTGFLLFACVVSSVLASAQVSSVKIMTWNLLNWPSVSASTQDSTNRCPDYRAVVSYEEPDILVTQENATTYSTTWFLNSVMNANGPVYRQGVYIHGQDTNNGIFYKDSLFSFVSNIPIPTSLRDITQFTLVFLPTGDTLRIYSVHLKASTGTSNEQQRASEVDALRAVTDTLASGTDFIVCGDFNIYGAYENAYQKLLQNHAGTDGRFYDPLNMSGTWNASYYSNFHTQSTRLNSLNGGSFGGMNDRFDMILMSRSVMDPTGVYYQPGSLTPVGNDGLHFDQSINSGNNFAVPADVADALYYASDHLPVYAWFDIGPTSGVGELYAAINDLSVFPNPMKDHAVISFQLNIASLVTFRIADISGKILWETNSEYYLRGRNEIPVPAFLLNQPGIYFLSVATDKYLINKKILVMN